MSGEKTSCGPCKRFQANVFNKSKCQNCFKSRELHLLTDHEMEQAKPVYGGWLCLAPEGTDFENPMQRSRKWQRRFFILYEHGSLTFALDELRSTLPQGTVDLTLCTEVVDAEPRTGQRNALCIITPELEIFIRGENKEIINGWGEQLTVFPRNNKQNRTKKHKVEPDPTQEPCPAKMAATEPCFQNMKGADAASFVQDVQLGPASSCPPAASATASASWLRGGEPSSSASASVSASVSSLDSPLGDPTHPSGERLPAAGKDIAAATPNDNQYHCKRPRIQTERAVGGGLESGCATATEPEGEGCRSDCRKGRSEARAGNKREKLQSCGDVVRLSAPPAPQRRAKSLDRRTSESVMTPDLLNFKKGWLVKLDEEDQWRKYWFVLSTDSLRYYKDSIAEEASDLEGEMDLTKCYSVSAYQVHRNYGFQIHTQSAVYTLSAMTAGIRRNWIHALMRNVHQSSAPDVASLPGLQAPCSPTESLPKPDVTQDSSSTRVSTEDVQSHDPKTKPGILARRRDGRYRTFDWAEFRPLTGPPPSEDVRDVPPPRPLCPPELEDLERSKRRRERRKKYESVLGFPPSRESGGGQGGEPGGEHGGSSRTFSGSGSQRRAAEEEEIERIWKQVERAAFRVETTKPLHAEERDIAELERLLERYRKRVEDLKSRLEESERRRLELEAQLRTSGYAQQQVCPLLESDPRPGEESSRPSGPAQSLRDMYREARELLQQQNEIRQSMQEQLSLPSAPSEGPPFSPGRQTPGVWLSDTEGNLQRLNPFLPDRPAMDSSPLLSPFSEGPQHPLIRSGGGSRGTSPDIPTSEPPTPLEGEDFQQLSSSDTEISNEEWSLSSPITEETAGRDLFEPSKLAGRHVLRRDAEVAGRLCQKVELLAGRNEALTQSNQEMLNQLTEADREIERLKAELAGRYADPPDRLPEADQAGTDRLERELGTRSRELLEARALIASLERRLGDAEEQRRLGDAREAEQRGEEVAENKAGGCLSPRSGAAQAALREPEGQLCGAQQKGEGLQARNGELSDAERGRSERTTGREAEIRRRDVELEREKSRDGEKGEETVPRVPGRATTAMRSKAPGKLPEMMGGSEPRSALVGQLQREEGFWGTPLIRLKENPSRLKKDRLVDVLLTAVAEHLMVERRLPLLAHDPLSERESRSGVGVRATPEMVSERGESESYDGTMVLASHHSNTDEDFGYYFTKSTLKKVSLLNFIASLVRTLTSDKPRSVAHSLWDCHRSERDWFYPVALADVRSRHGEFEATQLEPRSSPLICGNCARTIDENKELKTRGSYPEKGPGPPTGDRTLTMGVEDLTPLREPDEEPRERGEEQGVDVSDELAEKEKLGRGSSPGVNPRGLEAPEGKSDGSLPPIADEAGAGAGAGASIQGGDQSRELEEVITLLRERVKELEERLSLRAEEMSAECDGRMSSLRLQHETDVGKLKAAFEWGFASMEESHQKVLEELQLRHQQETERLLSDRDNLLEEETAATAIAIAAIKKAYRMELEREVQRISQSHHASGNTNLERIYQQHSEELLGCQRELEVLSQQFSLKCLESGHLLQALEAERKALGQCQQENQHLRNRNQELSVHLAAEINRLCSEAKQSQSRGAYQLEITLRVKESEVQCLKQQISSLKDELQIVHREKRIATKKFKDVHG